MSGVGNEMEDLMQLPRRTIHDLIRDHSRVHSRNDGISDPQNASNPGASQSQIGLLYRTMLYSPIMKWIFPARLRSINHNDIVFIGEEFVHVKQIMPNGELSHVALKSDFSSRIRAANIIGKVVDAEDTSLDNVFTSINNKMEISSDVSTVHVIPPQLLVLALECGDLLFLYLKVHPESGTLEFIESRKPMPKEKSLSHQPGRYIAVDQRNNLIAVAAHMNTIMIYKIINWDALNGKINPKNSGHTTLHAKVNQHEWSPIYHEQAFRVNQFDPDGTILGISFLNHADDIESTSLLVVVLRSRNRTKVFLYQGNENSGLDFDSPAIKGQALEEGASHPNLIIPSLNSSNFFLICESRIYSFNNALTQSLEYISHDTNPFGDTNMYPEHSASSDNLPVFTSWVHASRSKHARKIRESIYLLREDGLLLNISEEGAGSFNLSWSIAARFDCNGSSALASILLNNSLKDPDTLVAGGCISDGQVIQIGSMPHESKPDKRIDAMKPKVLQVLPNWSPIIDFAITSVEPNGDDTAIFMTTGRQPHAYLAEMRLGHEAMVNYTAYLGGSDTTVGTNLWGLRLPSFTDSILYFVSMLDYTEVFYLDYERDEALSLDHLDEPTLAVTLVSPNLILRVSQNHVSLYRILRENNSGQVEVRIQEVLATEDGEIGNLVAACAIPSLQAALIVKDTNPNDCRLAICGNQDDEIPMWKLKASTEVYDYTPTSITVFDHHGLGTLALLGEREGIRDCIKLDWESGPSRLKHFIKSPPQNSVPSMVAESIVVMSYSKSSTLIQYFVLCGYRGGLIELKDFDAIGNGFSSQYYERLIVGARPVTLCIDPNRPTVAFAVCGDQTLRVSLAIVHGEPRLRISNVWFTDAFNLNFPQPRIPILHVDSNFQDDGVIDGINSYISVFSDGNLFISKVNGMKLPVPRKIPFVPKLLGNENDPSAKDIDVGEDEPGTPYLVVPLKNSDVVVVAASRWEVIYPTNNTASPAMRTETRRPKMARKGQRLWRGVLYFVDRSIQLGGLGELDDEDEGRDSPICVPFSPGERILSVCEWHFKVHGSDREAIPHVVVGTSVQLNDEESRKGKLYFMQVNMKDSKVGDIVIKNVKKIDKPVRALAVMDEFQLVVCHDSELSIYGLRSDPDRGSRLCLYARTTLVDIARSISVNSPFIYVSTARKSFMALVYSHDVPSYYDDQDSTQGIEKLFGDIQARQTSTHLVIDISDKKDVSSTFENTTINRVVLIADVTGGLTVLSHPTQNESNRTYRISHSPIVQTTLSRFLSRLSLAPVRPSFLVSHISPYRPSRSRIWPLANLLESPPLFASNAFVGPDILGSSPSGAMMHLRLLMRKAAELLKFLENLVYWATVNGEGPGRRSVQSISIDPMRRVSAGQSQPGYWPDNMAVNGDKLVKFTVDGGIEALKEMLDIHDWEEGLGMDEKFHAQRIGNDVVGRISRFITLVDSVLGPHELNSGEGHEDDTIEDVDNMESEGIDVPSQKLRDKMAVASERCVLWLGEVLIDVL